MKNTNTIGFWGEVKQNAFPSLCGLLAMKFQWKFLAVALVGIVGMILYYVVTTLIEDYREARQ